jgi:hypothetical protein
LIEGSTQGGARRAACRAAAAGGRQSRPLHSSAGAGTAGCECWQQLGAAWCQAQRQTLYMYIQFRTFNQTLQSSEQLYHLGSQCLPGRSRVGSRVPVSVDSPMGSGSPQVIERFFCAECLVTLPSLLLRPWCSPAAPLLPSARCTCPSLACCRRWCWSLLLARPACPGRRGSGCSQTRRVQPD